MRHTNPVEPIAPQPQQFTRQQRPPLLPIGQPRQEVGPEQHIQQQMHELALEIYARAAADYLDADYDRLHALATSSQRAARAFFESMGVQFNG